MHDADAKDIAATLAGEGEAYRRIVDRHQQDVAGRMWRFTRDRTELEGLVEEVFVQAYTSLSGFRGEAPFGHWLARIATRVGYRFWKERSRRAATLPLENWDAPSEETARGIAADEAAELVHKLLSQLPPRDRLVLTLIHLEELSVAQAADRTGWSRTMVKVQAHRARKKLRALMDTAGVTEL